MRRIGVLSPLAADDPEERARDAAFAQGLQQLGWIVGQNVRIEYRWGRGDADAMRKYAAELVGGRRQFCREPGAAGRQRHRLYRLRIFHQREVAGAGQGNRASRDASGNAS
jgi:hypothetical protein